MTFGRKMTPWSYKSVTIFIPGMSTSSISAIGSAPPSIAFSRPSITSSSSPSKIAAAIVLAGSSLGYISAAMSSGVCAFSFCTLYLTNILVGSISIYSTSLVSRLISATCRIKQRLKRQWISISKGTTDA